MVSLIAKSPLYGLLPVEAGAVTLAEVAYDRIQGLAPFIGQQEPLRAKLRQNLGADLPLPNRVIGPVLWLSPGQYLILGDWIDGVEGLAAVTDQSDAWAILSVQGPEVAQVLSRLVPIDLRYRVFSDGQTARTLAGQLPVSVTRRATDRIDVMVMRSMAGTLVQEVAKAGRSYDSRK